MIDSDHTLIALDAIGGILPSYRGVMDLAISIIKERDERIQAFERIVREVAKLEYGPAGYTSWPVDELVHDAKMVLRSEASLGEKDE